ncbi:hypothetical protein MMC08_002669 [Hypocenomyce scalaris]|nr:hypothetical protein [Hypocenomyce scalaris]
MSFKPRYASTKTHVRSREADWIVPGHLNQSVQKEQKAPCHFLRLPGELRNQIYRYTLGQPQEFHINSLAKNKGLTHSQALKPRKGKGIDSLSGAEIEKRRRRYDLGRRLHSKEPPAKYRTPPGMANLLLISRRIHRETWHLFYTHNTFIFTSHTVLQRFLSALNPHYKGAIRRLKLQYQTYGEPYHTEDQRWKDDQDSRWVQACWRAAEEMSGLEELNIRLKINDCPLRLNLEAGWAAPLLAFRDRGLKRVHTLLHARTDHYTSLCKACAKVVSRELLGAEYKGDDEIEKPKKSIPKALKCLVIR